MWDTPLDRIKLYVNEREIEYTAIKLESIEGLCPNVNGRYLIQYQYKKEYGVQRISCCIPNIEVEGNYILKSEVNLMLYQ